MASDFLNLEADILSELEQYLLECNYPKLERTARKQRRAKTLSEAMEHFFAGQAELQSKLVNLEIDNAKDEMELPHFQPSSLEKAQHEAKKGRNIAKDDSEKLYLSCLLGTVLTFQRKYQEAIDIFDLIPARELQSLLHLSDAGGGEDSIIKPLPGATFRHIVGLQACYAKGVALEMTGAAHEAVLPLAEVTDFSRRYLNTSFLKSKGMAFFVGMSMYRYGLLCSILAVDPRQLGGGQSKASVGQLRGRLLFDSAVSFRMFLIFLPASFGRIRYVSALTRYMDALEARFKKFNYGNTFDPEQYALTRAGHADRFSPESVAEDVIYCTQLLESLQPTRPSGKTEAQTCASSVRVRNSLARLARHGHGQALVKMSKSLFTRYAGEASTYGRLVLSCAAAKMFDEAFRAGQIYVELGGREASVLLIIARTALLFPSNVLWVIEFLEENMKNVDVDMVAPLELILGLAYLQKATRQKQIGEALIIRKRAVEILGQAITKDDTDPRGYLYLSLAHLSVYNLTASENSIKESLSIEPDQPMAWYLFAVIKTAQKDFEACLEVCNSHQENFQSHDISITLLKAAVLGYLGLWEDAAQLVESLISNYTLPSGTVAQENSTLTDDNSMPASSAIDPAQFRARFYSPMDVSTSLTGSSNIVAIAPAQKLGLTISDYRDAFPNSASHVLVSKFSERRLLPETTLSTKDIASFMRTASILTPAHSILLAQQLWCALGEIYAADGKFHQAELCGHESFILNELDARVFALKALIQERYGRWTMALECYQLGLQIDGDSPECHLGCARCYQRQESPHHAHLALHSALKALEVEPENLEALSLVADLSRRLNLDLQATELYARALDLEECGPLVSINSVLSMLVASFSV